MFDKYMGYCGKFIAAVVATVGISAFTGSLFWVAWNSVCPSLFHLPPLTFMQSWAIHWMLNDLTTTLKKKELEYPAKK